MSDPAILPRRALPLDALRGLSILMMVFPFFLFSMGVGDQKNLSHDVFGELRQGLWCYDITQHSNHDHVRFYSDDKILVTIRTITTYAFALMTKCI